MKKGKNSRLSDWRRFPWRRRLPISVSERFINSRIRKSLKNWSIDSQQKMLSAIDATRNEFEQSNRRETAERRFRFFGERPQKVPFAHANQTHQKRMAFVMESSEPDRTGRFMVMQSRQVEWEVKRPIRFKGYSKIEVARA
jgi:hypothetical protein